MNFIRGRFNEKGSASSSAQLPVSESKKVPLSHLFFGSSASSLSRVKSISSVSQQLDEVDKDLPIFHTLAPLEISAQDREYDHLALLLCKHLERSTNRRRIHEYTDCFYGKAAVDWLMGSGIFSNPADARNALFHLLERRLLARADHTKPFFNETYERIAPVKAKQREIRYRNQHGSANRGFHDTHLYRFPSEAYCRSVLIVKVVGARNLVYRYRAHLGPFALHSKFVNGRIDPYCLCTYQTQVGKTDTCEDASKGVEWGNELIFFHQSTSREDEKEDPISDLWIRVFDFHELMGDMELGFVLINGKDIHEQCRLTNKEWRNWHPLCPSSSLSINDRTYGDIELSISLQPYVSPQPEWTVFESVRKKMGTTSSLHMFALNEDQMSAEGTSLSSDVTKVLRKVGDEVVNLIPTTAGNTISSPVSGATNQELEKEASSQSFVLTIQRCFINRVSDMKNDCEVWVEYVVKDSLVKGKSEKIMWPNKEMGAISLRGIQLPQLESTTQLIFRIYQNRAGLTMKVGEGTVPLMAFLPDLQTMVDENVDFGTLARTEKIQLKRIAAWRRNRKILVGEKLLKAVLQPRNQSDEVDDEVETTAMTPESMVVEDDLFLAMNFGLFKSSLGPFVPPPPLVNVITEKKVMECSLERLTWLVLSKNSPVYLAFCAKRNFTQVNQGEWGSKSSLTLGGSSDEGEKKSKVKLVVDPVVDPTKVDGEDAAAIATKTNAENSTEDSRGAPPFIKTGSLSGLSNLQPLSSTFSVSATNNLVEEDNEDDGEEKQLRRSQTAFEEFPSRIVGYTRPPETMVSSLQVKETWRLKAFSAEQGFWVEIEGTTNEPIYGDNMSAMISIVGIKESDTASSISIYSSVNWKSRPSFAAGLVERTVRSGSQATYEDYIKVLQSMCGKKVKKVGIKEEEIVVKKERFFQRHPVLFVFLVVLGLVGLVALVWLVMDSKSSWPLWIPFPVNMTDLSWIRSKVEEL